MKLGLPVAALILVIALPAWAGGSEEFDPDQPFREAVTKNLLRSWLNHAVELLTDHLEITGTLVPDDANGERRSHLRFKFYPEGKGQSSDSITGEASIDRSPDGSLQELYFRFTFPGSSSQNDPEQLEHVL